MTAAIAGSRPFIVSSRPLSYDEFHDTTPDFFSELIFFQNDDKRMVFIMFVICSIHKPGSLVACIFIVVHFSAGNPSNMIVVRRSKTLSSSRRLKNVREITSGSASDLITLLSNHRNSVHLLSW